MSLMPLSEAIEANALDNIRLIATDIDGTLTQNGNLPRIYSRLCLH